MEGSSRTVQELNLLTLNVWALPHISSLRHPRITAIAQALLDYSPTPDIVCLQELFTQVDFSTLNTLTASILPHAKFYHSGAFGSGLAILSRWPIEASSMFPYPLNGRPTAFWRGDWYVGKGIACAKIRFGKGEGDIVEVFNTHTHAPYDEDSYICHRTAQAWEMAKIIKGATDRGHLVAALGDFNMLPLSLCHRIITSAPVRDVWRVLHPESSLGPSEHPAEAAKDRGIPSAEFNLRENGATSNNVSNTWRWNMNKVKGNLRDVDPDTPDPRGQRLDYIFVSTGQRENKSGWVIKGASVAMTDRHPELNVSLSDHFAVQTTLIRHNPTPFPPDSLTSSSMSDYDDQLHYHNIYDELPLSAYDEILAMISRYTSRENKQRFWRGVHFYISLAVWIGCLVAAWFSPRNFVSFMLMLVGGLSLTAGTVDGLLALLFFSSEIRALEEFEWEIRNVREAVSIKGVAMAGEEAIGKDAGTVKT